MFYFQYTVMQSFGKRGERPFILSWFSGEPNENIVENHLNMALLNVFQYLNGRYRHIFIA